MRSRLSWLTFGIVPLAGMLVCSMAQSGCRGEGGEEQAAAKASAATREARPAGQDVIAMLGGLRVGSQLSGWRVSWIGAVDAQGLVRIVAERGGERMRLTVALDGGGPRPPATSGPYALYYEATERLNSASEQECKRAIDALAKQMSDVDAARPPPKGLRPLPRRSVTM